MRKQDAQAIEAEALAKGLTAPRVTVAAIDEEMAAARVQLHVFPGTTVTVAAVTLANGFVLIGKSAAASPSNFDADIGAKLAIENARYQLWQFLGFRLRDNLLCEESGRAEP